MYLHRTARALICAAVLLLGAGCSPQTESEGSTSSASADVGSDDSSGSTGSTGSTGSAGSAGSNADRARTTMGAPEQPTGSLVATAKEAEVAAHNKREGKVVETFENPTSTDVPLTFMVVSTAKDWVEVQLPIRPNGRTAWVSTDEVELTQVSYSLKVSTADKTLELYRADDLIESFPVATGTGGTPTPKGTFYLNELITPTNEGYGPFAYGISAFSEELTSFGGGPGQIGLHGTEDEDSLGRAISHGCIRMSNPAITKLSALLPLGTPIEIT